MPSTTNSSNASARGVQPRGRRDAHRMQPRGALPRRVLAAARPKPKQQQGLLFAEPPTASAPSQSSIPTLPPSAGAVAGTGSGMTVRAAVMSDRVSSDRARPVVSRSSGSGASAAAGTPGRSTHPAAGKTSCGATARSLRTVAASARSDARRLQDNNVVRPAHVRPRQVSGDGCVSLLPGARPHALGALLPAEILPQTAREAVQLGAIVGFFAMYLLIACLFG